MDIKKEKEQLQILETLLSRDKEEEALRFSEKLLDEFPGSYQINLIKARLLIKLKKYEGAESFLGNLEKNYPDNLNLLNIISSFYENTDKKEKSIFYLEKISFIDPFNAAIKEKIKKIKIQIERKKLSTADTLSESNLQGIEIEKKSNENYEDADKKFNTISAANLYINQGLYKDALIILENIIGRQPESNVLIKIQKLKNKIKLKQKIEILNKYMDVIKSKGVDFV